jgi:hypothetical protein
MIRHQTWALRALAGLAVAAAVAGCAPDTVSNRYATGFNAYLEQIAVACKPLMLGRYDMSYKLLQKDMYDDDLNYFMDLTSRLYYQTVSSDSYRSGINGFFGGGATTDRGVSCIIANLPADRPVGQAPLGGVIKVN